MRYCTRGGGREIGESVIHDMTIKIYKDITTCSLLLTDSLVTIVNPTKPKRFKDQYSTSLS